MEVKIEKDNWVYLEIYNWKPLAGKGPEKYGVNLGIFFFLYGASQVAQWINNLAAMQETWIESLGREDPLEQGMATHSSILAWRIPWTEEPGRLQSMESDRVGHDWSDWNSFFVLIFHALPSLSPK